MTPKSAILDRIVPEPNRRHGHSVAAHSVEDGVPMGVAGDQSAKTTRVVLVGRTGIDGVLRADPGLELVRVHSALDAIGEVAFPTEETDLPPVVVLSREVQSELTVGAGVSGGTSRLSEFVESLRGLNTGVRVIALTDGGPVAYSVLFDAVLAADATGETIRATVVPPVRSALGGATKPAPVAEPLPEVKPRQEPPVIEVRRAETVKPEGARTETVKPEAPGRASACGDTALVALVLKGLDPLPTALEVIRDRCADVSIQFVAGKGPIAAKGVAVSWDGAELGTLTSEQTPATVLAVHAKWLAGWMRMHNQHTQLREAAFKDHLTGAWNRRYFERFLDTAIEHARGRRQQLSVMIIDIDNFKQYNDQHGHEAGDKILCEIVGLLTSVIRPSDRVCRLGGDEFVVIFHDPEGPRQEGSKHPLDVHQIARRFQDQVSRHRFPQLADRSAGSLTVSGGLATFPWDGSNPEQLLARADQLALQGKRQGKNMITFGPGPVG